MVILVSDRKIIVFTVLMLNLIICHYNNHESMRGLNVCLLLGGRLWLKWSESSTKWKVRGLIPEVCIFGRDIEPLKHPVRSSLDCEVNRNHQRDD